MFRAKAGYRGECLLVLRLLDSWLNTNFYLSLLRSKLLRQHPIFDVTVVQQPHRFARRELLSSK